MHQNRDIRPKNCIFLGYKHKKFRPAASLFAREKNGGGWGEWFLIKVLNPDNKDQKIKTQPDPHHCVMDWSMTIRVRRVLTKSQDIGLPLTITLAVEWSFAATTTFAYFLLLSHDFVHVCYRQQIRGIYFEFRSFLPPFRSIFPPASIDKKMQFVCILPRF